MKGTMALGMQPTGNIPYMQLFDSAMTYTYVMVVQSIAHVLHLDQFSAVNALQEDCAWQGQMLKRFKLWDTGALFSGICQNPGVHRRNF